MSAARILDGKGLADRLRAELADEVVRWRSATGVMPGLGVILVGSEPASAVYVRNKRKAAQAAGFSDIIVEMKATATQDEIAEAIDQLNDDHTIHGILVQLPLPRHLDSESLLRRIRPDKDADGFHPVNMGLLALGTPSLVPCTPLGVRELLIREKIETKGKRAVVLGRSNIVGKPMALLLMAKGPGGDATVTVAHTASQDLPGLCREADILVVAAGQPELVKGSWIKPGAVVIDVGIHRRADGTLCGDVDFVEASQVASAITPVPGGVGPLTVAMLLRNTFEAAKKLVEPNR
ncbi:bifunctional methylenetetrahydrofolate dehydrogenase/methenyltetrahydrofolate cyclohydrolase FolD [bacterium]|nr:bifunctional methylenetetrahydrofolate dehydrogenase/methenyltetrahydrofolate cyclohydrolase FolD [bacterium]